MRPQDSPQLKRLKQTYRLLKLTIEDTSTKAVRRNAHIVDFARQFVNALDAAGGKDELVRRINITQHRTSANSTYGAAVENAIQIGVAQLIVDPRPPRCDNMPEGEYERRHLYNQHKVDHLYDRARVYLDGRHNLDRDPQNELSPRRRTTLLQLADELRNINREASSLQSTGCYFLEAATRFCEETSHNESVELAKLQSPLFDEATERRLKRAAKALVNWVAAKERESKVPTPVYSSADVASRTWDKATEARDTWVYKQCIKKRNTPTFKEIINELGRLAPIKDWREITSPNGIKKAANSHAQRYDLPPIPVRKRGRPRLKE